MRAGGSRSADRDDVNKGRDFAIKGRDDAIKGRDDVIYGAQGCDVSIEKRSRGACVCGEAIRGEGER